MLSTRFFLAVCAMAVLIPLAGCRHRCCSSPSSSLAPPPPACYNPPLPPVGP